MLPWCTGGKKKKKSRSSREWLIARKKFSASPFTCLNEIRWALMWALSVIIESFQATQVLAALCSMQTCPAGRFRQILKSLIWHVTAWSDKVLQGKALREIVWCLTCRRLTATSQTLNECMQEKCVVKPFRLSTSNQKRENTIKGSLAPYTPELLSYWDRSSKTLWKVYLSCGPTQRKKKVQRISSVCSVCDHV